MMKAVSLLLRMIFPALIALAGLLFHVYSTVWLKSERIRKKLRVQGIKGPSPSFLYGSLPEMHAEDPIPGDELEAPKSY
jgi:hypothetical protein